jgi:dipeptidyl aminopeptidase/acylaminoacyl peptidase
MKSLREWMARGAVRLLRLVRLVRLVRLGRAGRACATGVALAALGTAAMAAQPVEHFARLPLISSVSLSPDGQRYAALVNQGGDTRLLTRHLGEREPRVALSTDNEEIQFNWARWVNNERLIVSLRFSTRLGRLELPETRLVSVRFDGSGQVDLVRHARAASRWRFRSDQVVDWLPADGKHVLLQLAESSSGRPAVYRVNVDTGARELVKGGEGGVAAWLTDASHRVRVAVGADDELIEVRACDPNGENWRSLWRFKPRSADAVWPIGFGTDPRQLYVQAEHEGRSAVFLVDLESPSLQRRLVLSHPEFDVQGSLVHSARNGEVLGLHDQGGDERSHWLHPDWKVLAQDLDRALPDRRNWLLQASADERRYLVHSSGNGVPGQYFLGDRETGKLSLMAEQFPQLKGVSLAGKRPVRISARDGLSLHAFLTLPVQAGDKPRGPLVLLPHGGPAGQDRARFDTLTEMLADRGIAVLQVNFRGSAGRGRDFRTAGLRQWGLEMQDDLTDALKWAVAEGLADPQRVCIVGGSYGGYAALMGAVKTPQLYRCAASLNGVTDLVDLVEAAQRSPRAAAVLDEQIGHGWQDRDRLQATSPALQADRIEAAVLLVAGSSDRTVPVAHSRSMDKALRNAGKRVRYVEIPGGDHGLSRQAHRLVWYEALAAFLDEHLAPAKPVP